MLSKLKNNFYYPFIAEFLCKNVCTLVKRPILVKCEGCTRVFQILFIRSSNI